jgi:Zn-dependent metalloprotease
MMLKRIVFIFLIGFSLSHVKAQQTLSRANLANTGSGRFFYASDHANQAARAIEFKEGELAASDFIANINRYLDIPVEFTFVKTESNVDYLGMQHHLMQQYYKGIPLEGLAYRVHEKNGFVTSANGKAIRELDLDVSTILSEEQAFELAVSYLQTKDTTVRKGKKLIVSKDYIFAPGSFSVAFQFDIDVSLIERWRISVDAKDGSLINKESLVKSCFTSRPQEYDTGIGMTNYYGVKTIRVDKSLSGSSRLEGQTTHGGFIGTYDFRNVSSLALFFNDYTVYQFYSSDNNFNKSSQKPAVSVQWAAEQAYEYYYIKHGRNSFDNKGAAITSYVHVDKDWDNAAWTRNKLIFGDGSNNNPLVELDVVSHELTHGVTDYEANLNYLYEPGALNESFSDIMAKAVEFATFGDSSTWLLAKHFREGGLRDMSNPNLKGQPDTYLGDMWYVGYEDQGGVHTNSGVQNFWFYLLCEGGSGVNDYKHSYSVNSIGMDTVVNIAYRNLTEYLISSSDFLDCRIGSLLATTDLYGKNSLAYQEVANAWDAVGVIDEPIITSLSLYDTTATTVKLKGSLLPRGDIVSYHFEYGTTPELGSSTSTYEYNGTVEGIITGLQSETKYYVRLVATNENGSTYADAEFTTIAPAPLVKLKNTVDVTDSSAFFYGEINPNSLQTTFYFEYGPSPEMGLATISYLLSDTTEYINVSAPVSDLLPRQTYYYKLIAINDHSSSVTDSVSFFTALKPVISSFTPLTAEIGEEVTITGHGFNSISERNLVSFGACRATVLSSSATEMKVEVPAGASFGPISVLDVESSLVAESVTDFVPTFTGEFGKGSMQLRATFDDFGVSKADVGMTAVNDMDGDGRPDIVVSHSEGITVLQNVNTGGDITNESFVPSNIPISDYFYFRALVDLDGNGLKDIVGNYQDWLRIYPNLSVSGYIFFGVPVDLPLDNWTSLQFNDFDNDGHIDIAGVGTLPGDSCLFTVFRNQNPKDALLSNGFEPRYSKVLPYDYIRSLSTEDLDNDGKSDVIASVYGMDFFSILKNKSYPSVFEFEETIIPDSIRGRYTNYLAQDLNHDGRRDITSYTLYSEGKMAFFEADGADMTYMKPIAVLEGNTNISVQPGDIDGDGIVDLLVGDYDGRFMFLKNNTEQDEQLSGASFELFEHYGINENNSEVESNVILNDLNADGRPEAINNLNYNFYPFKGHQLEIWQNTPNDCVDPSLVSISVEGKTATIELPSNTTLDQFDMQYISVGSSNWRQVASTTLTNLPVGAKYRLRVRAMCYLGFTGFVYLDFGTDCVDLSSFYISDIQAYSVRLHASSLSALEIEYSKTGMDQWKSVSVLNTQILYLDAGTTYDLRYRGRCYTPTEFTYTQFTTLCPALSSLVINDVTYNRAVVSWTSTYEGAVVLEYSDDNITWTQIDETQTMSSLIPGTEYFVRGALTCSDVSSGFIYNSFSTPCPKVSELTVKEITPFSAIINWIDASGTDNYTVRYSATGEEVKTVQTNSMSLHLEDLIPGTYYSVSVAPECIGHQDFTSTTFTTVCFVPYNLSTDAITHTSAEISWDDHYGGLPYYIDYAMEGSDVWSIIESATTTALLEELRPGTEYEVRVHIDCSSETAPYASLRFETALYEKTTFAPNPTEHTITIYPSKNIIGNQYGIYDDSGRRVAGGELTDYAFDMSRLSAGVYILKIEDEEPMKIVKH